MAAFIIDMPGGAGIDKLVERLVSLLPEGPFFFSPDQHSDVPETVWLAEVVRERIEGNENVDLADMVVRMAESLAETIMLAPKEQWGELLAEAIRHLGNTVLSDLEDGGSTAH